MAYRGQYGDRGAWQDPQGRHEQSAYRPGPYQDERYQDQPYQGRYQDQPYQDQRYRDQPDWRQGARPPVREAPPAEPERSGGADGNERLTAITGAVLLLLLAAEGFTILSIGRLLTLHFFIGMLLLGPVLLKAGSVFYRFFRYYTGSAPYRRKGPPAPLLRLLGPFLMLLTATVFGSGIMLAVAGPAGRQPWLLFHKGSFILWFGAMAIHVLAYVSRLPRLLSAEARGTAAAQRGGGWPATRAAQFLGGRGVRLSLLIASLAVGLVIALLTVHLAGAWEKPGVLFFN